VASGIGSSSIVDAGNHVAGDRMGRIDAILAGAPLSRSILSPSALLELARVLLRIQWVIRKSALVERVVFADKRS
jgi:hypothetical protein